MYIVKYITIYCSLYQLWEADSLVVYTCISQITVPILEVVSVLVFLSLITIHVQCIDNLVLIYPYKVCESSQKIHLLGIQDLIAGERIMSNCV